MHEGLGSLGQKKRCESSALHQPGKPPVGTHYVTQSILYVGPQHQADDCGVWAACQTEYAVLTVHLELTAAISNA